MCSCRTLLSVAGCIFNVFGGVWRFWVTFIASSLDNIFIVGEQCCRIIKKNHNRHMFFLLRQGT